MSVPAGRTRPRHGSGPGLSPAASPRRCTSTTKHSRIEQYHNHKEGVAIRTETTINDTRDFAIGKRLENAGAPDGRLYHCAMAAPGGVHVFDVWESQEKFDAFGATLMPILAAAGADPGEPMISEIHNTIVG